MFSRVAFVLFPIALAFGSASAPAAVLPAQTTYSFSGVCADCTGTAHAELVLQGYTLGNPITSGNFISFHYDGTDLLSAFTVTSSNLSTISGSVNGPLPAAEDIAIFTQNMSFQSTASGFWCVGYACSSDYGSTNSWNVQTAQQSVPEPISAVLLGSAVSAAFAVRRRS